MRRLVLRLFVLHAVAALLAVGASPAHSHWDQPHRIIGGLTSITDLPEPHRKFFRNCGGMSLEGLTWPDEKRDRAFILTRLVYMTEHQESSRRSQNAYRPAAKRYAEAVRKEDYSAACEAISQLSISIHYLQDAADATKMLDPRRQKISRLVSSYIVKKLLSGIGKDNDNELMKQLRRSRDTAEPIMASLQIMPPENGNPTDAVANYLMAQRKGYAQRLNEVFQKCITNNKNWDSIYRKLENLNGRDDALISKLEQELPRACRDDLISIMIDVFGLMWAAQDRYLMQFVKNWYLIKAMVVYDVGENPKMRCEKIIYRVVEAGASGAERDKVLEQVREELKNIVPTATGQLSFAYPPAAMEIKTSNEKIDQPVDPEPKCVPDERTSTYPIDVSPNISTDNCRKVCVQWTGEWEASDGRHHDCCPYPAAKKCIGTKCTKKYKCTSYAVRCDGGVPQPPPEESPDSASPFHVPDSEATWDLMEAISPPAPLYTPPPVQTYSPPIRHTEPPQIYVRPPQVQPQTPSTGVFDYTTRPPEQGATTRPPQQGVTTRPPEQGVTTRPPQQGVTTRPPQQGVSTGVQGTRTNQVSKPPCRCLKQEKYWYASDGRHKTCCPNPQQKRCIATKCEQRTKCLQWGPPGCVRSVR